MMDEMDPVCFQRLIWGFEAIQSGLKTLDLKDWNRVLTCVTNFVEERSIEYQPWFKVVFLIISREVAKISEPIHAWDVLNLLELFSRAGADRQKITPWAKDVILNLPRKKVPNDVCRQLAPYFMISLSKTDYQAWCDGMQLARTDVPIRAPNSPAPVHNRLFDALVEKRRLKTEQDTVKIDKTPKLKAKIEEIMISATTMAERLATIEKNLMKQEVSVKQEMSVVKETVPTSEVIALKKEVAALQERLKEVESSHIFAVEETLTHHAHKVSDRAKQVFQSVSSALNPVEETMTLAPSPVDRFNFDDWLLDQRRLRNDPRNYHDPVRLASLQSQLPSKK